MTAARVVVVGAVLLVVVGGIYVADRNRAHSRIDEANDYQLDQNNACFNQRTLQSAPNSKCDEKFSEVNSWQERKGWYEYAAGALVVLTLAGAFAASRQEQRAPGGQF
jgi:hypothetical protein